MITVSTYEFDIAGYLEEDDWTVEVRDWIAAREGVALTDEYLARL